MPTPVSSARQCLTDEAARALDDAVSVARRRSHSQTTSLHAVSALLSPPTSTLRDACARAHSLAYSPRLQFRALELCVGVSLDRLPSKAKTLDDDEPPVSNSLMAAIKRSQANQRRHPETFQLYSTHQDLHNSQSVKVELKHFVLSILDDPIVSRVFGDAGFRSSAIKIAIVHPPSVPAILRRYQNTNRINFPFAVDNGEEEDFKRIGSVLVKKTLKNPLLIGVSAHTVVTGFTERLKIGKVSILPAEIEGLEFFDIEKEIREFVLGDLSEDLMNLKLQEVRGKVESCRSCGVIVNLGDLKCFLDGGSLEHVVSKLSDLVRVFGGKLWLIGWVGSYDIYMKILVKFPNLEKEWDLSLVPITGSTLSTNGPQLKSSLMGSFVPFGGFFPLQTEIDRFATRCDICNEKCEQEVSVGVNGGRTVSVADQQSTGFSSWLQIPESDSTDRGNNVIEARDHSGVLTARVMGLKRKWSDICHRLHHNPPPQRNPSQIWARGVPFPHSFQSDPKLVGSSGKDSNQENRCRNVSQPIDFVASTSSSQTTSLTMNLSLGTVYVSPDREPSPAACETVLKTFYGSGTFEMDRTNKHVLDEIDFKKLYRTLADKLGYQNDSIRAISQTITRVRTGNQRRHVWFMFSGPDPVGKKKICTALADVVFGSPESLICIDLNFENQIRHPGSVFNRQNVNFSDPAFRGKTVTEFISEVLTKKPRSVVVLENVDKADFLTKDNLSRAIKSGKLTDMRGRETRITDAIFVFTTSSSKDETVKDFSTYSEESILNAKALQMRISVEKTAPKSESVLLSPKDSASIDTETSEKRKIMETGSFEITVPKVKKPRSCFDLNLPSEETEESDNETFSETKESWLEEVSDQVDETVAFEPFDFDCRAETILKEICRCFEKSLGSRAVLEIKNEVMVQILASCWLSDGNGGVEKWIETVLCRGFMEVGRKQNVESELVVKLVVVEGVKIEEDDAVCVCLPSRIIVD
ncbi:hypothetical protein SSX86_013224 [Deinandra increscens subsp. villosa]|uniref:Clp R domain-containing protein n=1 Tax=Deinandra increscens subsp. villosa TaxID=3103831 RepID=A0AAP0D9Y0_9ASTR